MASIEIVRNERKHTGAKPFIAIIKAARKASVRRPPVLNPMNYSRLCKEIQSYEQLEYISIIHERSHTGESPLQCAYQGCGGLCGQSCRQQPHPNEYKLAHSGARPFHSTMKHSRRNRNRPIFSYLFDLRLAMRVDGRETRMVSISS